MIEKGSDDSLSIASSEFLWAGTEPPASHDYLAPPVLETLRRKGCERVLDLGCGNGHLTHLLASAGFDAVGCDGSASGIAAAKLAYPDIQFFIHDILAPLPEPLASTFDAVVCLEVIEHLLLPRALLTCAYRALRPGGILIMSTPYHGYLKNLALAITNHFDEHWHPLRDYGHVKFFSFRTLKQVLGETDFLLESLIGVGRIPLFWKSMIAVGIKR